MKDIDLNDVIAGVSDGNSTDSADEHWTAVIRPPETTDSDPREAAERLFAAVHGLGKCSYELHSDGENVEIHFTDHDRRTANAFARHARAEIGARADVAPATMPIERDDPLAGATFRLERDTIYPIETDRTDSGKTGSLRHVLDTLGEEDVRGVYQVVGEPVDDWATRRSRALPEPIASENDPMEEARRGAAVFVPATIAVFLAPVPLIAALPIALALLVAGTVGEGIRPPERRTASDLALAHRDRVKDAHGARSTAGKNAEKTADVMSEQGSVPGWRASVRLVVSGESQMDAHDHRDRLVSHVERAFSSDVTGQKLTAETVSGSDARDLLDRVQNRDLGGPQLSDLAHRALAHGNRREMHVGPAEFAALGNFPDADGGANEARSFSSATETSKTLPSGAPSFTRPAAADGGAVMSHDYHLNNPTVEVSGRHGEYGEVELKVNDDGEILAGDFVREMCESATRDGNTTLGYIEDSGRVREVCIPADQLPQHMFICGASGAGKTTLAEFLALQHAHAGRGFAIIDPHNDLVDDVKRKLPKHRKSDVISIDPEDTQSERTVTINFLDVEVDRDDSDYEEAVNAAVSDIVSVLGQGASSMGDRMKPFIRAISRGMIVSEEDFTLVDMREFFVDDDRRWEFAAQMRSEGHEHIAEVAEEIAEMDRDDLSPITRLLQKWVLSPVSRQIIENEESSFSFREALDEDRIILIRNNLSDDDLQRLVATAYYRKIVRAAVSRPKGDRSTYPVIIDEADDIASDEMNLGDDLGNARKWGVSLCLMTQLPKRLKSIKEELETNCKTFISYACPSPTQASTISSMYDCEQSAVGKLGDFYSQIQIDIDGERSGPYKTASPAPMPPVRTAEEVEDEIDKPSRERFGVERQTDEPIETDGGEDDRTPIEAVIEAANEAVEQDVIEAGEQYTHVHAGTERERLRINPNRTIEKIEGSEIELAVGLDEVRSYAREHVDDSSSAVTGYRQNTPPAGRCLGIDLTRVHRVDTGQLSAQ